jgi:proline dehydrogenase
MAAFVGVTSLKRLLRAGGSRVLGFASRAYVPGAHLSDALVWARRMDARGVACTLGYFNADGEHPASVAAHDRTAIEALEGLARKGYVSFKVPALQYDAALLESMAADAELRGQYIHFDSHGPETAQATIDALALLQRPERRLSLTIPARWARSPADADWAVEHGVRVRVVKGQWECPERPGRDMHACYMDVIARLAGRASAVAVASHDAPLARQALELLRREGTPCELELLCGLPRREMLALARELDVPARLYIPFGEAWLPYALDQAVRSPKLLWWVMRDTFSALR